jgi:hypothetical protein
METMEEFTEDNLEGFDQAPEESTNINAKDAIPLCLHCLRPCNPYDYYCSNCDSNDTVNPITAYLPFVQIRYNYGFFGKVWRKVWYENQTAEIIKILYLFFIAFFVPFLLLAGIFILFISRKERADLSKQDKIFFYVLSILLIILSGLIFGNYVGFHYLY